MVSDGNGTDTATLTPRGLFRIRLLQFIEEALEIDLQIAKGLLKVAIGPLAADDHVPATMIDHLQWRIGNHQLGHPLNNTAVLGDGDGGSPGSFAQVVALPHVRKSRRGRPAGKTLRIYSVEKGSLTSERLSTLSPAQQTLLQTLLKSPRPLDVLELTEQCKVGKKTITNGLSVLKARQMIRVQDKAKGK